MLKTLAYATLFSTPRLFGSSAYAADNPPGPANPHGANPGVLGVNFVTKPGQVAVARAEIDWRRHLRLRRQANGKDDDLLLDKERLNPNRS